MPLLFPVLDLNLPAPEDSIQLITENGTFRMMMFEVYRICKCLKTLSLPDNLGHSIAECLRATRDFTVRYA